MKKLKEIYKNSFLMGNIYTPRLLENKPLKMVMNQQFNSITAENIMKPMLIQPKKAEFFWDDADDMVDYGEENDFKVVGHTLAWHQQTLYWIDEENTTRDEALALLREHLTQIMTRYKGKIIAWDALNEAIEDGDKGDTKNWRNYLRNTPWLRMIGEDYINHVFQIAHEIDPNAILYYNDYNLNYQHKREATYYMVKELREAGIPIHGIGMQGHYHTNTPIDTVEASLKLFASLEGIEVSVTELDVTVTGSEKGKKLSRDHEIEQAQYYAQLFQIYKKYDHVIKRVTFWGTDDATSWRRERFPTIFNKDYSPKLAFDAIVDPDGFLHEYPLVERDITQTAVATYGTPVFGNIASWIKSDPISISRQLTAWEGATAVAYAMWDDENLYLLTDVTVSKPHANDSVDIFINSSNAKLGDYNAGDHHIAITSENKISFNEKDVIHGFESTTKVIDGGYQVEVKIPLKFEQMIGFDMQVNDANEQGIKQSTATWNDFTGSLTHSTSGFGNINLVK